MAKRKMTKREMIYLTFSHKRGPKGSPPHAKKRKLKPANRPWNKLNAIEKSSRVRGLEVLRIMQQGISFTQATKYAGTDARTAKAQLGGYIFKRKRRWHATTKYDTIERGMIVYEKGKIKSIVSCIGSYLNDVKLMLSGKMPYDMFRRNYRYMTITDVDGKEHRLETRLEKLKDIELSREEVPFSDIYDY
jgi:hypothetical protein